MDQKKNKNKQNSLKVNNINNPPPKSKILMKKNKIIKKNRILKSDNEMVKNNIINDNSSIKFIHNLGKIKESEIITNKKVNKEKTLEEKFKEINRSKLTIKEDTGRVLTNNNSEGKNQPQKNHLMTQK